MITAADDPEAFRKALVARLAFLPAVASISLGIGYDKKIVPPVRSDRFRLSDSLMALLEELEAAGCQETCLGVRCEGKTVDLVVEAKRNGESSFLDPVHIRRHTRRFHLCGGFFSILPGEGQISYTISFPVVL